MNVPGLPRPEQRRSCCSPPLQITSEGHCEMPTLFHKALLPGQLSATVISMSLVCAAVCFNMGLKQRRLWDTLYTRCFSLILSHSTCFNNSHDIFVPTGVFCIVHRWRESAHCCMLTCVCCM